MAAILKDGKLRLSGDVGDLWYGDCFTSGDVVAALAQIGDDETLDVHINSGGGIATEGAAIHALLSARSGTTNVVVEGIAASAASLIAMAGATVTMSAGAIVMIHDPSGWTMGTSEDHAKTIEGLEALATSYSRVYARKSGRSADECRTIMKEETWLTPEMAVEMGFADATTEDEAEPVAAFDYRVYAHAPNKLVALAASHNWRRNSGGSAASAVAHKNRQENTMTDKERADKFEAELKELRATMAASTSLNSGAPAPALTAAADAVAADRTRRKEIMALDEAKGRETLATFYAEETEDSVERVKKALAAAPKNATDDDEAYTERRLNGEGLGGRAPTASGKKGDKAVLASAVERTNKRR